MMTAGVASVPIYPTLGPEQIHYLLENSGARAAFMSTGGSGEKVQAIRPRLPALENIITFEAEGESANRWRR